MRALLFSFLFCPARSVLKIGTEDYVQLIGISGSASLYYLEPTDPASRDSIKTHFYLIFFLRLLLFLVNIRYKIKNKKKDFLVLPFVPCKLFLMIS